MLYIKSHNGKIQGFDVDIIQGIAKNQEFKVKFQGYTFAGIIPAIQASQVDVLSGGSTITAARLKVIRFSNAYYHSGLSIVVKKT